MPRNIYHFLSFSLSLPISKSIPTSDNICIFLSSRLFLQPVKFIFFYHCKKNLDHIVFPSRSFISNLLIFIPLTHISQFYKYITLYIINILNLSLMRITLKNQHLPRLEPQPRTHRYIAKRLVY